MPQSFQSLGFIKTIAILDTESQSMAETGQLFLII